MSDETSGVKRAERRSRSLMLHGYGGAALRVFGTYIVDDDGKTPQHRRPRLPSGECRGAVAALATLPYTQR